jgi:hypothetical protein
VTHTRGSAVARVYEGRGLVSIHEQGPWLRESASRPTRAKEVLAVRETAISWMRHGLSSCLTAMLTTSHARHGFGRMDAKPSPAAYVLLQGGLAQCNTLTPLHGNSGRRPHPSCGAVGCLGSCGGMARRGWAGLGVCMGIPARVEPQGHVGSGGRHACPRDFRARRSLRPHAIRPAA